MNLRKRKAIQNPNDEVPESVSKPKRMRLEPCEGIQLLDLPMILMHMIIAKLNPRHRGLLRCVSKKLNVAHINFMLHYYKNILWVHTHYKSSHSDDPKNFFVWQVLADAVKFFLNSGFEAIFADNFVSFNNELRLDELEKAGMERMHELLHKFYQTLETSVNKVPSSALVRSRFQRCRLLHTVTMLNLLRQFRKFRVISSGMNLLHWKLHIEVCGIFMSVYHPDAESVKEEDKIVDFVAFMAELLFYDKSAKQNVTLFTEIGNSFYSYGMEFHPTKRGVRLDLKFNILAPASLHKLLEEAIEGQLDSKSIVDFPLIDAFSIQLEVKSVGAGNHGSGNMMISIVPLS